MDNNILFLFLVVLLSSLVITFRWIYRKKFLSTLSPINLLFLSSLIFCFFAFIACIILGKKTIIKESINLGWGWLPLIILAILGVFTGFFINQVLTKHDVSVFVPSRIVLTQIFIILASILILKEKPNYMTWIAFGFFITGLIIMIFSKYKK